MPTVDRASLGGEAVRDTDLIVTHPRSWSKAESDAWHRAIPDTIKAFEALAEAHDPADKRRSKLDAIMAHIRDICRHTYGSYQVPDWYVERTVQRFKEMRVNGKLIWPHDSTPVTDPWTGEILYKPISRAKLSPEQERGILDWLSLYMVENKIPSHDPRYEGAYEQT